jgi:hypothetical protein
MTDPIGSIPRPPGPRRVRGRRSSDGAHTTAAGEAEAAEPAAASAPIAPVDYRREDAPPALSAQIIGQSGPAENAAPAKEARRAHSAYLEREWSGPHDRRTGRGRIAKTDV